MRDNLNSKALRVEPGKQIILNPWPTRLKPVCKSKEDCRTFLQQHVAELSARQDQVHAHDRYALLLILQVIDATGKDGPVKHVTAGVNLQGRQAFSFKHPSARELDRDFLWRTTRCLPERGIATPPPNGGEN